METKGLEPSTPGLQSYGNAIVSGPEKELTEGAPDVCTSEPDLVQIAADLRSRLTPEECQVLAHLLVASD